MYDYIQISKINDFMFCPHSLYYHSVYEGFNDGTYKASPQITGTIAHETIDNERYSTRKNILQAKPVFSEKYGIIGKIDIFDTKTGILTERKYHVKKLHDGYYFQMYAQKICLEEMGYKVNLMFLHSIKDNRTYVIMLIPYQKNKFNQALREMRVFDPCEPKSFFFEEENSKCKNCIYRELCRK